MKNNEFLFLASKANAKQIAKNLIHPGIESAKAKAKGILVKFNMSDVSLVLDAHAYIEKKLKTKVVDISTHAKGFSFDVEPSMATPIFKAIKEQYNEKATIKRSKKVDVPSKITIPLKDIKNIYDGMMAAKKIQELINSMRTPYLLKAIGQQLDKECPIYRTHDFATIKGSVLIARMGVDEDGQGNKIHPDKEYVDENAPKVKLEKKLRLKTYHHDKVLEMYYHGEEEIIKVGGWNKVYEYTDQAYKDAAYQKDKDHQTQYRNAPLQTQLLHPYN